MCSDPKTAVIYMCPEDFGGHDTSGPASLWSLQELRAPHGRYDASRRATLPCRIAEQMLPLGILTNLPGLQNSIELGLPVLKRLGNVLHYYGPLPKSCGCSPPHPPRNWSFIQRCLSHSNDRTTWKAFLEVLFHLLAQSAGFQPRYGWRYCDCLGTQRYADFVTLVANGLLGRNLQAVAASRTHQALPSRLNGRYIHFWFLHRSDWCVGPLHGFAVRRYLCSLLRYSRVPHHVRLDVRKLLWRLRRREV